MKRLWDEWKWAIILLIAIVTLALCHVFYMHSAGYSLQWSQPNMRYIWVDKDGKP